VTAPTWERLAELAEEGGLVIALGHSTIASSMATLHLGPPSCFPVATIYAHGATDADRDAILRRLMAEAIRAEADIATARRLRSIAEQRTAAIETPAAPPPVLHEESGSIDLGDQSAAFALLLLAEE
jgi:hypothetical protein